VGRSKEEVTLAVCDALKLKGGETVCCFVSLFGKRSSKFSKRAKGKRLQLEERLSLSALTGVDKNLLGSTFIAYHAPRLGAAESYPEGVALAALT
jgi:hypothetical protein